MLTCREIAEQASDYVDGRMTRRQAFSFRLHLSLCKNCRRFIDQFRTTISYVRMLPEQPLSAEQVAAIVERVVQKSSTQKKNEE